MKNKKVLVITIVAIIVILGLTLFLVINHSNNDNNTDNKSTSTSYENNKNEREYKVRNIANSGDMVEKDDYIYYKNRKKEGICKLQKESAEEEKIISDYWANNLCIYNNYIYYLSGKNNYNLTINRAKLDGTEKTVIKEMEYCDKVSGMENGVFSSICIVDDIIYYTISKSYNNTKNGLYKININGQEDELIQYDKNELCDTLFAYGNYILFTTHHGIYRYDMESCSTPELIDYVGRINSGRVIGAKDNYIYTKEGYRKLITETSEDSQFLYNGDISLEVNPKFECTFDEKNSSILMHVYTNKENSWYKMDVDGSNIEKVEFLDKNTFILGIVDNYIYYYTETSQDMTSVFNYYRIKINGEGKQEL